MSLYPVSLVFPNVRCEALLSLVNGPWITFSASYFSQNLHLPNITQSRCCNYHPISSRLSPPWTNGKPWNWHFPPSRQSGDKGQKCHLSSQISSPNLYMILGNVSISIYWQKNDQSCKFLDSFYILFLLKMLACYQMRNGYRAVTRLGFVNKYILPGLFSNLHRT